MNQPLLDAILSNVDVEDAADGQDVVYRIKTGGGDFVVSAIAVRTEDRIHGWTYSITDWAFEPATGPVVIEARPWSPEESK